MSPRARSTLVFGAKGLVATVLITWLVRSGALDFRALAVMWQHPSVLALDLGVFAFATMTGALRWRVLLGLADVKVPFARLLQLQLTALFFNVVIPGNVGGDVVKALYVARDADPKKRTTILLIVFVERLLGLGGLVLLASVITAVRGAEFFDDLRFKQLATVVVLLGVPTVAGPIALMLVIQYQGARLAAWTSGESRFAKLLSQLVAAARLLASGPKRLFLALALSMLGHAAAIGLFTVLTRILVARDVSYAAIATVFPLGILTMVLPISPAGLGVGHVAFDRLFAAIGLTGGATVFNVYVIGQIAPCLMGVFPYLALKRKGSLPTAAEAETPIEAGAIGG